MMTLAKQETLGHGQAAAGVWLVAGRVEPVFAVSLYCGLRMAQGLGIGLSVRDPL